MFLNVFIDPYFIFMQVSINVTDIFNNTRIKKSLQS